MGIKTPTGNWTRTPRLTTEDLNARAIIRHESRKRFFVGSDGKMSWTVETHKPPHQMRGTPARLHRDRNAVERIRMFPGSGPVSRLSMVC